MSGILETLAENIKTLSEKVERLENLKENQIRQERKKYFLSMKELSEFIPFSIPQIKCFMKADNPIPFHQTTRHGKVYFYLPEVEEWLLNQ